VTARGARGVKAFTGKDIKATVTKSLYQKLITIAITYRNIQCAHTFCKGIGKLSLLLINQHAMKVYEEVEV
jgi:hypothetical protein